MSLSTPAPPAPTPRATRRLRRFTLAYSENFNVFVDRFEVLLQQGVGLSTGQGAAPIVMFRYSKDGGSTWSSEIQMSVGAEGQYGFRTYVNRLGRGRNWIGEISTSDPVFFAPLSALIDVTLGTN